jgi:UDP-glucose 4-epimerase
MGDRVLVTGGAGYIGAHACKALARAGFVPVAFDNLSTGWAEAVKFGPLVQGDLMDRAAIDAALAEHRPVAVMHFAALSLVGVSMQDPGLYWRVNVGGALNLIEACAAAGVRNFVFSSTCATYGDQDGVLLTEDTPQRPINAYGGSKRAIEDMLKDFGASHGLRQVIFRYFNVAGRRPRGRDRRTAPARDASDPADAGCGGGQAPGADGVRDGLSHPRWHLRARLCACDRPGGGACAGAARLLEGRGHRVFCLGTGHRLFGARGDRGQPRW